MTLAARLVPGAIALTYVWMMVIAGILFRPVERRRKGSLLLLSFFVMFYALAVLPFRAQLAIPAAACIAASLLLFNWAAFSIRGRFFSYIGSTDTPPAVFQGGPFAHIRHPFYTSYLLAHLATTLAYPHWITVAALLAAAYSANDAAAFEEEKFARSTLAEEYQAYTKRAPRFLPKLHQTRNRQA